MILTDKKVLVATGGLIELQKFALKLGLLRTAYFTKPTPHYELKMQEVTRAIDKGAIVKTSTEIAQELGVTRLRNNSNDQRI